MSLWKHAEWWGAPDGERVSLGEGHTPLVRSARIGPALGLSRLWFKLEGANPTGSYKDRFAAAAVSHLRHDGKRLCLGTSSGNTGAALAAYCARAGIACVLAIVEGAPQGKLRQMRAHGARLVRIRGFGSSAAVNAEVIEGLRVLAAGLDAGFEVSAFACSPRGMAGVQTLGFEIGEDAGMHPFDVFCPAGGGGLTLAVARGLAILAARSGSRAPMRVHCVQPEGNDTIASALRSGAARARSVESRTAISGLQVGGVIDGDAVIEACRASGGQGHVVTDEAALRRGELRPDEPVICLVTGSGFKDERSLGAMAGEDPVPLVDDFAAFAQEAARLIR
jgi:threonine synthase